MVTAPIGFTGAELPTRAAPPMGADTVAASRRGLFRRAHRRSRRGRRHLAAMNLASTLTQSAANWPSRRRWCSKAGA
jgi:hypothetical protein